MFTLIIPVLLWRSLIVIVEDEGLNTHVQSSVCRRAAARGSQPDEERCACWRWSPCWPVAAGRLLITLLNYIGISALVAVGLVLLTGVGGLHQLRAGSLCGREPTPPRCSTSLTCRAGSPGQCVAVAGAGVSGWCPPRLIALLLGSLTRCGCRGHYLPLGTIAWGISLYFLFGTLPGFLGAQSGLSGLPPIRIGSWALDEAPRSIT